MNATALNMPNANPSPAPATARPPVGAQRNARSGADGDDDAALPSIDAGVSAPPPSLLGAWQAALLARETSPGLAAAGAAGAVAEPSSTQHAVAATTLAGGHELGRPGMTPPAADAPPLRIEADFKTGTGPAWQLGLQRGPDAAAWSLNLATSSVPAAWATTQLPRLERRLRLQGHDVDARWDGPSAQQQAQREVTLPEPRDEH